MWVQVKSHLDSIYALGGEDAGSASESVSETTTLYTSAASSESTPNNKPASPGGKEPFWLKAIIYRDDRSSR
jgi:hypothetical protein